jgi:hypothetical protein
MMNGNDTAVILVVLTGLGGVLQAGISWRAWRKRRYEADMVNLAIRTASTGRIVGIASVVIPFLVGFLLERIAPSLRMTSVGGGIVGYLCLIGAVASWLLCQGGLATALVIANRHERTRTL